MDKRDSGTTRFLTASMADFFKSGSPALTEEARRVRRQIQKLEANRGKTSKNINRSIRGKNRSPCLFRVFFFPPLRTDFVKAPRMSFLAI